MKLILRDKMVCQHSNHKSKVVEYGPNAIYRLNCGCLFQEHDKGLGESGFEYLKDKSNCERELENNES